MSTKSARLGQKKKVATKKARPVSRSAKKAKRAPKNRSKDAETQQFVELFNRLGESKDPVDREKIARKLARLTFGC